MYADTGTKDEPIQLFYSNIHTSPLRDNDADSHLALLSLSRQQLRAFTRLMYNTLSSRGPIEVRTFSYQTVSRARIRTTMSTAYFIIVTDLVQNTSGRVQHFDQLF